MRRNLSVLLLVFVFAMGVAVGFDTEPVEAAGGFCFWTCGCNGVAIKCCYTVFGLICAPDPNGPVQCPQIADC